jgi:hypothetical protein
VNSAGNEFDSAWEIIGAPADASDILSIGSISPITFLHSDFSSIGPTADGRMKPDLCAVGELYVAHEKMEYVQGTSFAAPLVTGFVACIQEMHPTWNAYEVMEKMRKSGHLFPYFDYAHGFGVPQARFFMNMEMPDTTLDFLKTSFSHCEFYRKDSLFFELSFCFKNDSLINEQLKNLGFGINNSMKEQTNAFISVLNENGELKSFGFNRVQTEYRFGDASYASPDDAPSEFEYFFGLPDLTIPSCPNCTIRVHFLDQIINLPLANE